MDNNSQILATKNEIVATTNSLGWHYILKLADKAVVELETLALAEDDETKVIGLQRQAKGARVFLTTFLQTVEAYRRVDVEPTSEDDLIIY